MWSRSDAHTKLLETNSAKTLQSCSLAVLDMAKQGGKPVHTNSPIVGRTKTESAMQDQYTCSVQGTYLTVRYFEQAYNYLVVIFRN